MRLHLVAHGGAVGGGAILLLVAKPLAALVLIAVAIHLLVTGAHALVGRLRDPALLREE